MFAVKGSEAVIRYLIGEVQRIYVSEGAAISDKHIEVIIRQMLSRVMIKDAGDTNFVIGDVVEKSAFLRINREMKNRQTAGQVRTASVGHHESRSDDGKLSFVRLFPGNFARSGQRRRGRSRRLSARPERKCHHRPFDSAGPGYKKRAKKAAMTKKKAGKNRRFNFRN